MNLSKTALSFIAAMAAVAPAYAQQFDLSSQRKEDRNIHAVTGKKLSHGGYVISPTPHELSLDTLARLELNGGFAPDRKVMRSFGHDFHKAGLKHARHGAALSVECGPKKARRSGVKEVAGAYSIDISERGVSVCAFDEAGVFYAFQTLRQLIDNSAGMSDYLPCGTINDYPDLPVRGVVEGFYGNPWSHKVRLALIDFYGRNKMTDYIYGPKDDPFHSSPMWRLPYPADQAKNIRELVDSCRSNHVNFVWAIHPGKDIRWDKADTDSLMAKLDMMYDLGVRAFALFFDDISGRGADSRMHTSLVNHLTKEFVRKKGDVADLMICPTDYSELWANPSEDGQLAIYGKNLDPGANVFWTGAYVCSDLTRETLGFVNGRIGRPALYWWNFPVNDYCRNHLLQGPAYGLDTTLTRADVAGIVSNPMEQGAASMLALYGVADYAWNTGAYNPLDNWERGLRLLAPEAPEAYRRFAIHSCDTQSGYRRAESWETPTFAYNDYSQQEFESLRTEFEAIAEVPEKMDALSDKELLAELHPWLEEFGSLGRRGVRTLDLIKIFEDGASAPFWEAYVANIMSDEDRKRFESHISGSVRLHPFCENAMEGMLYDFYTRIAGHCPAVPKAVGTYSNLGSAHTRSMFDNDTTTYYTSGIAQHTGHWLGIDLGETQPLSFVEILQGRNSVDDSDYFDKAIVEASADGERWHALTDTLTRVYDIHWSGEPVEARYVRLRKLESDKRNWIAVRSFRANPPSPENIGVKLEADNPEDAVLAFDRHPGTACTLSGRLSFSRRPEASSVVMLFDKLDRGTSLAINQADENGSIVATACVESPYAKIELTPCCHSITIEGNTKVFEIIQK